MGLANCRIDQSGGRPRDGGIVKEARYLIVTADDFGIGPATTRGILELAALGRVSATVLLVNSPYAQEAVWAWRQSGQSIELGWHPCLTLDRPLLPAALVPGLVDKEGRFFRLRQFLWRVRIGRIAPSEVRSEERRVGKECRRR